MLNVSQNHHPGPTVVELALRWGDMDLLGHINNVQIARLFEEARVRAMGDWFGDRRRGGMGLVVAHQETEFAASLMYSVEPARCEVVVSRIGGKSFDFACRLSDAQDVTCALNETTVTAVDLAAGRAIQIPEELRQILQEHQGDPAPFRRRR